VRQIAQCRPRTRRETHLRKFFTEKILFAQDAGKRKRSIVHQTATIIVVREATVGPLLGTRFVSGCAMETSSQDRPSASATTWLSMVLGALAKLRAGDEHREMTGGIRSSPTSEFK